MPKKKNHLLANLFLRMLLALFSVLPITLIFTANTLAATHSGSLQQYLALGDSLAFGYQPNQDFTHGYAIDLFQKLQAKQHYGNIVNLGCPGETSSTFIGISNCPVAQPPPPQLLTAVAILKQNAGNMGLVTLQIGANDLLSTFNLTNCTVQTDLFNTKLAILDYNLTQIILPQLHAALKTKGKHHAHLALIKYYNPFQPLCANTGPTVQRLNHHLEEDAEGYAETVDIYEAFNQTNTRVCQLTWICSTYQDIHANNQGYQVIARRIYHEIY